jgi:hypothetical protein
MNRRLLLIAALAAAPLAAGAQDKGVRKKGGGVSFIQLDTLTATITRSDGRRGVMTVEVGVDVSDPVLHARAAESIPLLRAAYSEVLRSYATGLPPASAPDADYLSRMLQRQTDLTLGRAGARVLLGSMLVN